MKNKWIGLLLFLIVGSITLYYNSSFKKEQNSASKKIEVLSEKINTSRDLFLIAYQKRHELMLRWIKETGTKASENVKLPFKGALVTESELAIFDQYQSQVTSQLTVLMQTHSTMIKNEIKQLEKIEENINQERKKYHDSISEFKVLNEKFNFKKQIPPIFPAEKVLQKESNSI